MLDVLGWRGDVVGRRRDAVILSVWELRGGVEGRRRENAVLGGGPAWGNVACVDRCLGGVGLTLVLQCGRLLLSRVELELMLVRVAVVVAGARWCRRWAWSGLSAGCVGIVGGRVVGSLVLSCLCLCRCCLAVLVSVESGGVVRQRPILGGWLVLSVRSCGSC